MVFPGKTRAPGFSDLRDNPALARDGGKSRAHQRGTERKYDAPHEHDRKRLRRIVDHVKQSLAPFYHRDKSTTLHASVPAVETITRFLDAAGTRSRLEVSELRKVLYALGVSSEDTAFVLETLDPKHMGAVGTKVIASTFLPSSSSSENDNNDARQPQQRERRQEAVEAFHQRVIERVQVRYSSVKDAFRQYDTNRAGVLTPAQFRVFMRDLGFVGGDVEALIRHLDRNGQAITFNAFAQGVKLSNDQAYVKPSPKKKVMQPLRAKDDQVDDEMDPMECIRTQLRHRVIGRSKSIREVFMEFDADGNGYLDHDEFKRFMAAYNFTPNDAMIAIEFLDQDFSGTIDYDEFANGLLFYRRNPAARTHQRTAPMTEDERNIKHNTYILEMVRERLASTTQRLSICHGDNPLLGLRDEFSKFDSDGSGALDYQEFSAFLIGLGVKLSPRDFDSLLLVVDQDKSNEIEFHEFASLFGQRAGDAVKMDAKSPLKIHTTGYPDRARRHSTQVQPQFSVSVNGLDAVFNKYDVDSSGQLDYAAFSQLMRDHDFTQADILQVMKQIDEAGDHRRGIDLATFKTVVNDRGWKLISKKATSNAPQKESVRKMKRATVVITSGQAEAMLMTRILRDHQSLEDAFRQHTVDGSGELEYDEFRRLMKHYGVHNDNDISRLIAKLDADGNGTVSLDEFLAHFQAKPTKTRPKPTREAKQRQAAMLELKQVWLDDVLDHHGRLEDAFREYDRQRRNELDYEQFRDFMAQHGVSDDNNVRYFLSELDTDQSGTVSLEEFLAAFQPIANKLKKKSARMQTGKSKAVAPSSSLAAQQAKANAMRLRLLEEQWIKSALEQHGSVREAFNSFDTDGNRLLDHDEFAALMKAHGTTRDEDIAVMIKRLDLDGSGVIDYDEFSAFFQERHVKTGASPPKRASLIEPISKSSQAARLRELEIKWIKRALSCHPSIEAAFAEYDRDGNGHLDHEEFTHCMKRYGIASKADIARLIKRLDLDTSGTIDLNEFMTVFNPLRWEGYGSVGKVKRVENDGDSMDEEELASVLEIERELAHRILKGTRDMRLAFRKFDINGNGKLEYKEFRQVLKTYKFAEPEIRKVIRHLDRDVSGWIDYREFMTTFSSTNAKKSTSQSSKSKPRAKLTSHATDEDTEPLDSLKKRLLESILKTHGTVQSTFRKYDSARNGCLTPVQFETMLVDLGFGSEHTGRLLTAFDRDKSGTIEYEEFLSELIGEQR